MWRQEVWRGKEAALRRARYESGGRAARAVHAAVHAAVVWCGVRRASALMRPKMSVADHVARKAAAALRSTRPTHGALSHCRESRPG